MCMVDHRTGNVGRSTPFVVIVAECRSGFQRIPSGAVWKLLVSDSPTTSRRREREGGSTQFLFFAWVGDRLQLRLPFGTVWKLFSDFSELFAHACKGADTPIFVVIYGWGPPPSDSFRSSGSRSWGARVGGRTLKDVPFLWSRSVPRRAPDSAPFRSPHPPPFPRAPWVRRHPPQQVLLYRRGEGGERIIANRSPPPGDLAQLLSYRWMWGELASISC
jgi:hypothetical protein